VGESLFDGAQEEKGQRVQMWKEGDFKERGEGGSVLRIGGLRVANLLEGGKNFRSGHAG